MTRLIRRHQRKLAAALLMLNISGARAVAISEGMDTRVVFTAGLGFKAITKTVMRQRWKTNAGTHYFGERSTRYSAQDLETMRRRFAATSAAQPESIPFVASALICAGASHFAPPGASASPPPHHHAPLLI